MTLLHWAVWIGDADAVRFLLDAGADTEARGGLCFDLISISAFSYFTPLHIAVYHADDTVIINALLDHGADINAMTILNHSVLMWATAYSDVKVVKLLLERGANPLLLDFKQRNALFFTGQQGRDDNRELLQNWIDRLNAI